MKLIGPVGALLFSVGPVQGPLRTIEIWLEDVHLTLDDSSAYLPSFIPRVASTTRALKGQLNFLAHEHLFVSLSVQEALRKLVETADDREVEEAWSSLQLMSWGPTTDSFLCFLLPIFGKLHMAFSDCNGRLIRAMQIAPYDLIRLLESLLDEISAGHEPRPRSDA